MCALESDGKKFLTLNSEELMTNKVKRYLAFLWLLALARWIRSFAKFLYMEILNFL